MTTDRELLELAAKAAGYKKYIAEYLGRGSIVLYDDEVYSEIKERRVTAEKIKNWNPLTDDCDALRLAEKCSISFGLGSDTGRMRVVWFIGMDLHALDIPEDHPMALPIGEAQWLRFAIVRAAAEIGEGLAPFPTADEIRENWT